MIQNCQNAQNTKLQNIALLSLYIYYPGDIPVSKRHADAPPASVRPTSIFVSGVPFETDLLHPSFNISSEMVIRPS